MKPIKSLSKQSNFHQGIYRLKNPDKYINQRRLNEVVYRSSWEKCLMIWFDKNPDVLKWGSEETIVSYISKYDGRPHRYFVDFTVIFSDGSKLLIEVKPRAQTEEPKKTERKTKKRFLQEVKTYAINTSKWDAAKKVAEQWGGLFVIWTETELQTLGIRINVSKQFRYSRHKKA